MHERGMREGRLDPPPSLTAPDSIIRVTARCLSVCSDGKQSCRTLEIEAPLSCGGPQTESHRQDLHPTSTATRLHERA
jgi:hypothetical protein